MNTLAFDHVLEVRKTGVCPVCRQSGLSPRGIGAHVRSWRHKIAAAEEELRAKGWVRVHGIPMELRDHVDFVQITEDRIKSSYGVHYSARIEHRRWVHYAIARLLSAPAVSLRHAHTVKFTIAVLTKLRALSEAKRTHALNCAAVAIALGQDALSAFEGVL